MATQNEIKVFFETIGPLATKVCKERGYDNAQAWTCMCQAACESAYGTSALMKNANAYFGIKGGKGWLDAGHKLYSTKTKECYDGNNYVTITDTFRAYDSMEDSVRDYFDLMATNRYKESLTKTTVHDCITVIKNAGYATDPKYISTIDWIFNNFNSQITRWTVDGSKYIPQLARPMLKINCSGSEVFSLQSDLNYVGKYALQEDGKFGPATQKALKDWQLRSGLDADGIYGNLSYNEMKKQLV